jgi:PAS domain S-box-containing protein
MFYSNTRIAVRHTRAMMRQQAVSLLQVILASRCWERGFGGLDFKACTTPRAMDPGSSIRQILNSEQGRHVQFHVASRKPGRATSPPDAWESEALQSFQLGNREQWALAGDGKTFRYMAPLRIESSCLSCHDDGSYEVGELRGGVSITLAADPYMASQNAEIRELGLSYSLIWLFGFGGLGMSARQLLREHAKTDAAVKERYQLLFEDAPVAYHEVALDGVVVAVNKAECELLGFEREAMIGRPVWDFVAPAEREISREAVQRKLAGTGPLPVFERLYARSDGTVLRLEVHENRMHGAKEDAVGIRSALLNITGRKEKEEELARRTAELARSNAELEQFAYVASHDLQEPLRMVASYTQLLARRYKGKLGPDADDFIAFAVDGAARMSQLINDLLAYSRVGSRKGEFRPTSADAALASALTNVRVAIKDSAAVIHHAPLPTVYADPVQLVQVFQNLLGNAMKFRNGAPPEIGVACEETPEEWCFSVRDNGIGIDPKYADRIFQVFQRLHNKEEYPGTGIGLATCKKIAERHGGRIWVVSQPGQGAAFHFTIRKKRGDMR